MLTSRAWWLLSLVLLLLTVGVVADVPLLGVTALALLLWLTCEVLLFTSASFVRDEATFRFLPPLVDAEGRTRAAKRHTLLPPPGINRLPRPGSGSELLDLRDYLPGDPPKTIAWKVSARRDRLITKEFESEVPVRCTLFLDTAHSVRLRPPGQNALPRLVAIRPPVPPAHPPPPTPTRLPL